MPEYRDETQWFTVTDLKEYTFCPRVSYYELCLPSLHRETIKTTAGRDAHQHQRHLAARRTLIAYDIPSGERFFDVPVASTTLGMIGEIDEVVATDSEAFPVDYKNTERIGYNFKLQLTAYGLMLSETLGLSVRCGFVYVIPRKRTDEIVFSPSLVDAVYTTLSKMRYIAETEATPQPTQYRQRCSTCKYRRFCNDV